MEFVSPRDEKCKEETLNQLAKDQGAPIGVAQLLGSRPAKGKITDLIPSQDTRLACRQVPSWVAYKRPLISVFLSH